MPFTPAHAVAALPFRRTRLDTSALVVGCLSPDFEYFLRLSPHGMFGHTFAGMFLLDLPLSLSVLWLFHRSAKAALVRVWPGLFPFQHGLEGAITCGADERPAWIVVASVLLGASSHILWDSLTHPTFWTYRHLMLLHVKLRLPIAGSMEVYKLLQYGSTLLGTALLFWYWVRWVRSADRHVSPTAKSAGWILPGVAMSGAVLRVLIGAHSAGAHVRLTVALSQAVTTIIALLWIELVLLGFACHRLSTPHSE